MVAGAGATRDVLDRALAALKAVVPYDLAAVFRLRGERLEMTAAAGALADARVRNHSLELDHFPTLRRAM